MIQQLAELYGCTFERAGEYTLYHYYKVVAINNRAYERNKPASGNNNPTKDE